MRTTISSIAVGLAFIVSANGVSLAEETILGSTTPSFNDNRMNDYVKKVKDDYLERMDRLEKQLNIHATQNQSLESQKLDRLIECIDDEVLNRKLHQLRQLREKIKKEPTPSLSEDDKIILDSASAVGILEATIQDGPSVSVGTVAGLQMYSYDLATKTASLANGFGIGTPIRIHGNNVHAIKDVCRTRSYRMATLADNPKTGTIDTNHWLSITPTMYVSKNTDATDIAIQPALVLSFWHDILHFGTGFNLSGPNQGNAILFFGVGTQLAGETK